MGVKHLATFMHKLPDGLIDIQIKDEIEKYKRFNNNKCPAIIIDLLSFSNFIWTNPKEIFLGGRYNIYNERLRLLFEALADLGADIYFIYDGPLMKEKLPELLKRRNADYEYHCRIIKDIENGAMNLNDKTLCKKYRTSSLPSYTYNIKRLAKKYFKVIKAVREGDQDTVYWANEKKAFAIISSDTDFLIFEGNWKLWDAKYFNTNELKIKELNRCALRKHLSLCDKQLVLLATLASNDFVDYNMILHFHREINATRNNKFYVLAKIVRNMTSLAPNFSISEVSNLINMMFKPEDRTVGLKTFWQSIRFYLDAKQPPNIQNNDLFSHSGYIWSILNDRPVMIKLFYFDLTNPHFKNFYRLIREVIRRQLGIILKGSKLVADSPRNRPQFYIKTSHDQDYYRCNEEPVYPEYDIPLLLKLCLTPMGHDENLDKVRKKLLCWLVSADILNTKILEELPQHLVLPIIIILYLLENKQIGIDEADCLLFSSISSPLNEKVCLIQFKKISSIKNFRLSFLYQQLFPIFGRCVKILGLNCYDTMLRFDGLVFHYLRSHSSYLNNFRAEFGYLRVYKKFLMPHKNKYV